MVLLFTGLAVVIALLSSGFVSEGDAEERAAKNVYKTKVGTFEVYMLSEGQRDSDASILIGASSVDVKKFIPSGSYPSAVNAFVVRTPDGVILIDTGFGRELFGNLASVGISPDDVASLLITHSHGDHIGGLVKSGLPSFPKAKVYIAKREFDWSSNVRDALGGYGDVELFTPGPLAERGTEIIDGVRAIAAYGHTPGHTIFLIESLGERLLIWGDLTHAMAIQMPRPNVSVTYDSDPAEAAEVRKVVLSFAMEEEIPVAGMHVAYPAIGRLERDSENQGGYRFVPLPE
ncbi:MAG: MBL fold metallo-hydrolase [Synergistaceae bacterium]|jgi:glyoxylase-like metal-dependent hydrolase (beta-lactamase superfamily II)|nr:MBL fold metallo-hydrolase [Synergistaceae bacterium]